MEEMILRAIDLNLKEICFTDHVDYDIKYMDHFVVDYEEYFKSLFRSNGVSAHGAGKLPSLLQSPDHSPAAGAL